MQKAFPFAFLILLLTCTSLVAQGTIVHVDSETVPFFSSGGVQKTHPIDLDGNGTDDFSFEVLAWFEIFSTVGGRTIGIPASGFDLGSKSVPLLNGFSIGENIGEPLQWTSSFQPIFPPNSWIGAVLHGRNNIGSTGFWNPPPGETLNAFVGVEFPIDGNSHYGWIRVEVIGGGFNGGRIMDWAYNSVPGESILAGQVPEPSTWALMAGGLVAFGLFRLWRAR